MRQKIIVFFITLVLFLTSYPQQNEKDGIKTGEDKIISSEKKTLQVNLLKNDNIVKLDLEDYIVGVVACEMPASFNIEALKAMSVAARTYAMYKMNGKKAYDLTATTKDQCYITNDEMKAKWKNNYNKYYNIIKNAVNETDGEYMTYKDKVIIAFYFIKVNGF